ncbi:MAG: RNA polymerase sigma-70 factor [Muribaculaceae bacterium]|nr:RNA polymerase sigma-70 factor [Muribaculaceae bacterium]
MNMSSKEFERNYRKMYMPLCMFALRIVEDTDVADDVVQVCFMKVWDLIRKGHEIASLNQYMYRTVRNYALSRLRTDSVFSPLEENTDMVSEEEIDTAERDGRLWKAIDEMPPRRREIFLMSKRDGMTYAAIAEELGLSVKTVENQISKALASLRNDARHISFLISFL